MDAASPAASPTTSGISTPSSPAATSSGGSSDSSTSTSAAGGSTEHIPPRRRLVKASSRTHFDELQPRTTVKREGGAGGVGIGPPGFAFDRSSGTPPAASVATGAGTAVLSSGLPASPAGVANTFRDRAGIRPIVKGDVQGDYPILSPHGAGGTSVPPKVGRPPFGLNSGLVGDIRPLGRRSESTLQRRHELPLAQKHTAEDMRIQQAKRACLARAQTMGATGNYKSFDSPFGNYMVPVIPNHLFNKSPTTAAIPGSPSNINTGVQGR